MLHTKHVTDFLPYMYHKIYLTYEQHMHSGQYIELMYNAFCIAILI